MSLFLLFNLRNLLYLIVFLKLSYSALQYMQILSHCFFDSRTKINFYRIDVMLFYFTDILK